MSLALGLLVSLLPAGGVAAAGCGVMARAGLQDLTISSGGLERSAVVFVPPGYSGQVKVPVVFDLHGSNSFPRDQLSRSHWAEVASAQGFLVVAPEGGLAGKLPGTHAWNVPGVPSSVTPVAEPQAQAPGAIAVDALAPGPAMPDDVAFLRDTVAAVKAKFCVDPDRIYASGYSGGGRMLSQYLCNGHGEFAAAGFVMSLRAGIPRQDQGKWLPDPESCHPGRPISIIAFWGQKDTSNPYAGGGRPYWQYGGEAAIDRWADLAGCEGKGRHVEGSVFALHQFDRCKGGARILSYVIAGQSHDWPPNTILFPVMGSAETTPHPLPAAARMWAFFDRADGSLVAAAASPVVPACDPVTGGGKSAASPDPKAAMTGQVRAGGVGSLPALASGASTCTAPVAAAGKVPVADSPRPPSTVTTLTGGRGDNAL